MRLESLNKIYNIIVDDYASLKYIVRKTGISYTTVLKIVKMLDLMEFCDKKVIKSINMYKLKPNVNLNMIVGKYGAKR